MFKLFKRIKYAIISEFAERKINKECECEVNINIKVIKVQEPDGRTAEKIKTEITAYKDDYKKLIDVLLKKSQ